MIVSSDDCWFPYEHYYYPAVLVSPFPNHSLVILCVMIVESVIGYSNYLDDTTMRVLFGVINTDCRRCALISNTIFVKQTANTSVPLDHSGKFTYE